MSSELQVFPVGFGAVGRDASATGATVAVGWSAPFAVALEAAGDAALAEVVEGDAVDAPSASFE